MGVPVLVDENTGLQEGCLGAGLVAPAAMDRSQENEGAAPEAVVSDLLQALESVFQDPLRLLPSPQIPQQLAVQQVRLGQHPSATRPEAQEPETTVEEILRLGAATVPPAGMALVSEDRRLEVVQTPGTPGELLGAEEGEGHPGGQLCEMAGFPGVLEAGDEAAPEELLHQGAAAQPMAGQADPPKTLLRGVGEQLLAEDHRFLPLPAQAGLKAAVAASQTLQLPHHPLDLSAAAWAQFRQENYPDHLFELFHDL